MNRAILEKYRQTNDEEVSIYIDFKNEIHNAGDMVEGAVNIFCGLDSPQYRFIRMTFFGSEDVRWWVSIEQS